MKTESTPSLTVGIPPRRLQAHEPTLKPMNWNSSLPDISPLWRYTKGKGIKVAILDSGADISHPALGRRIKEYEDFTGGVTRLDEDGHGTMVAGIIAANQSSGSATGVAPEAELYVGKVIRGTTGGEVGNLLRGIEWAAEKRVNIINICLEIKEPEANIHAAIKRAISQGICVICAAGNNGYDGIFYPAAYEECITVGAVNRMGIRWEASSMGSQLDIVAMGERVRAVYPIYKNRKGYSVKSGTSMAAAFVTGVAVLGLAKQQSYPTKAPIRDQKDLLARLRLTAIDRSPKTPNEEYGYGEIDPMRFFDSI
jgi:subtilisin family serine protease